LRKKRQKLKAGLRDEALMLLYAYLAVSAAAYAVFHKESLLVIMRAVFGLFWVFTMPGFALLFRYQKFSFLERLIAGTMLGVAVTGVLSYFLSLFGIAIGIQWILVPSVIILAGIFNTYLGRRELS
jgi:uncharacterized membrane protein